MNKSVALAVVLLGHFFSTLCPAQPPPEERTAYLAAMGLYRGVTEPEAEPEPGVEALPEPPKARTPEQWRMEALAAFQGFLSTYPQSELRPAAQYQIGWCYWDLGDGERASAEFSKVISEYPESGLVDDARYQTAFIDYSAGSLDAALVGFRGVIGDYEYDPREERRHKVPFAYFMVAECYRKKSESEKARAAYVELIARYPRHSQVELAKKRLR